MYGNGLISNYGGNNSLISQQSSVGAGAGIWMIISFVAALIGCFVVYFVFVTKKENPKQNFLVWLKSFLSFDKMMIEVIVKIAYIFTAIFITLASFSVISTSFLSFVLILIFGNLIARLTFEAMIMGIMIWKNTTEIKNKLK